MVLVSLVVVNSGIFAKYTKLFPFSTCMTSFKSHSQESLPSDYSVSFFHRQLKTPPSSALPVIFLLSSSISRIPWSYTWILLYQISVSLIPTNFWSKFCTSISHLLTISSRKSTTTWAHFPPISLVLFAMLSTPLTPRNRFCRLLGFFFVRLVLWFIIIFILFHVHLFFLLLVLWSSTPFFSFFLVPRSNQHQRSVLPNASVFGKFHTKFHLCLPWNF